MPRARRARVPRGSLGRSQAPGRRRRARHVASAAHGQFLPRKEIAACAPSPEPPSLSPSRRAWSRRRRPRPTPSRPPSARASGSPDGRAHLPLDRAGPHRPRRARARARDEADRERRRGQGRAVAQGRPAPDGGGLARRQVRHPHHPAAGPARGPARPRPRAAATPVGPTYATPAETAFAVLSLQHDVTAAVVQLIDGSHGTGLKALSTTLYLTLDRRDRAIQDIKALRRRRLRPRTWRGRAPARVRARTRRRPSGSRR